MMRIFLKKFVLTLFPILLCTVNSAWAVCEAEAEMKIDAIFELERPRPRSLAVTRVQKEADNSLEYIRGLSQSERSKVRERWISWLETRRRDNSSNIVRKNFETATLSHSLCLMDSFNGSSGNSTNAQEAPNRLNQQQQTSQSAQQQSQQAQQTAQQNQARADQQRQGKRKTNDPAAQAHNCIEIDKDAALYGGFKNTCEYKVSYVFCNFRPKIDSWAEFHNCEKPHGIGADGVGAGKPSAAHTKNTEMVYWFACKAPSWPVDSVFVLGKGIEARCHN